MQNKLTLKEKLNLFKDYVETKVSDKYFMIKDLVIEFYDEANKEEIELTSKTINKITQEMYDEGFMLKGKIPLNFEAMSEQHRLEYEKKGIKEISISVFIDTKQFEIEVTNLSLIVNKDLKVGYWNILDIAYTKIIHEGLADIYLKMKKTQDELLEEFLTKGASL